MADLSLSDYLASLRHRRFAPGVLDCGIFMADWVMARCGRDPIADVRGRYGSEREFLKILRREGGFEASCVARLAAVGYRPTAYPESGDLMIVLAPYARRRGKIQRRPTGAICVSDTMRAIVTSDLGIVIADDERLTMLRAWSL